MNSINSKKIYLNRILKASEGLVGILICAVVLGVILMVGVYSLPTERMYDNLMKSAPTIEKETESPKLWYFYATALDNHADSVTLLMAVDNHGRGALDSALNNWWVETINEEGVDNPGPSIVNLYYDPNREIEIKNYARYWHGSLLFVKPLLMVTTLWGIRILNLILQSVFCIYVIYRLYKTGFKYLTVGYGMSLLALSPISSSFCIEYSGCIWIMSIGILMILKLAESVVDADSISFIYFFFAMGIATSFFDFLTYPLVTIYVPMLVYMLQYHFETLKAQLYRFVVFSICWGIGYIGMWGSKWLVATLLTDTNVFSDAFNSVEIRMGAGGFSFPMIYVYNIGAYLINPVTLIMIVLFVLLFMRKKTDVQIGKKCLIFVIIGVMPFIWYGFAKNHSYDHFWFTFRNLAITSTAAYAMLEVIISPPAQSSP